MSKLKITEVSISVGQTIQVRQYEPRVYQTTLKAELSDGDDVNKVLAELKEKANSNVKEYFESLDTGSKKKLAENKEKLNFKLMPEILTQPNIPKPLHGIAPRTIMGQTWWNETRKEAYASTEYHCQSCGVSKENAKGPKWLEAHELWDIDYRAGSARIVGIYPLCHYCHNFIHSGRLSKIVGLEKSETEVKNILEHGFAILASNGLKDSPTGLKCFPETLDLAEKVGANTYGVEPYEIEESEVEWKDWYLVFNGKKYHSNFDDYKHWEDFYSEQNIKQAKEG